MGKPERLALIKNIQEARESHLLCYFTSDRPGLAFQIGADTPRLFFDHLKHLDKKLERLDLFLYSAGGDTSVPWRIVSLLREFSKEFNVLVPYRAYSAATLLSLGADKIVMGRKAELGPIDPSVANDFNPTDPISKQRLQISVEDVYSYISLVREKMGIVHQPELGQAFTTLTNQVHPLALGNVNRQTSFIRMIAANMLKAHKTPPTESKIDEIVKNLVEKIYFHGHGINRDEAKSLGLNIENMPLELEKSIWELYLEYENSLLLGIPFNPQEELTSRNVENYVMIGIEGAFIESDLLSHAFRCDVNLGVKRQVPQSVNISANLQVPPEIAQGQINQQVMGQLQQLVQQLVMQQLRAQSPIVGYEAKLGRFRWEKEEWPSPASTSETSTQV